METCFPKPQKPENHKTIIKTKLTKCIKQNKIQLKMLQLHEESDTVVYWDIKRY